MKAATFPEEVLQLRIQIRDIAPPIFRIIQVKNTRTFHLLHEIIQWSFGWGHEHLYEFTVGRGATRSTRNTPKCENGAARATTRSGST